MAAVQKNGHALRYVKNQTWEICMAAAQQNGYTALYINAEIFDSDEYINMLYVAIFKSINFGLHNIHFTTTEDKIYELLENIDKDIIDKVLMIRKRSTKRAL
jgi:hypothetical protein